MSEPTVTVQISPQQGYQFNNRFGGQVPDLRTDEPPPLGTGTGPDPTQLLCSAVGNCLAASLQFSLAKYKQDGGGISADVRAEVGRNADKRLRVLGIAVRLTLGVPGQGIEHLARALAAFEDFCTVTGSIRAAIPVQVDVFDSTGAQLK